MKALIAEADRIVSEYYEAVLEGINVTHTACYTVVGALREYRKSKPDFTIVCLRLPLDSNNRIIEGEGFQALRKLDPDAKILFISGLGAPLAIRQSKNTICLSKPVGPRTIMEAIKTLTGG